MTDIEAIRIEMLNEAATAAKELFNIKSTDHWGDCGFAWTTISPLHKGNTKAGKAERKRIEQLGFTKDWTGKAYQLWDPARYGGQRIDIKEAGAVAAANVLKRYGFKASAGSRLD
jgi:hypothetical protein